MIARLLTLAGLVILTSPQAAEPPAGPARAEGLVAEVQLLDATPLGAEAMLILVLEDGRGYLIPGQRNLATSRGMKVGLDYLPAADGEVAVACAVQVLAVPVIVDGESRLQTAHRPFTVYRNPSDSCADQ
ncbi:MAG: hypothetical protein EA370_07320 [Wenzhouxiangella sp.]|nr:MAG: hypothetical protein EA370_07320 [Wenzhouxiangella sp.]